MNTQMQKRKLGQTGLEVSAIGLGCMGMSFFADVGVVTNSLRINRHENKSSIEYQNVQECSRNFGSRRRCPKN